MRSFQQKLCDTDYASQYGLLKQAIPITQVRIMMQSTRAPICTSRRSQPAPALRETTATGPCSPMTFKSSVRASTSIHKTLLSSFCNTSWPPLWRLMVPKSWSSEFRISKSGLSSAWLESTTSVAVASTGKWLEIEMAICLAEEVLAHWPHRTAFPEIPIMLNDPLPDIMS